MTFIDLFAGIGGFRLGMELAGHKCLGFCEFDKFAVGSYTMMHLTTKEEQEYIKNLPTKKDYQKYCRRNIDIMSGIEKTSDNCEQMISPKLMHGVSDSHVKTSVLQGNKEGSEETEADFFTQLLNFSKIQKKKIDPQSYSLKMLKIYYLSIEDSTFSPFSLNWTKSGMMQSGRLSTLPIMFRKTERGCLLSDILEDEVDEKYFLSKQQTEKIIFQ